MDNSVLAKYLLEMGLFDPERDLDSTILDNDELLSSVAALWDQYEKIIRLMIKARVERIRTEIIEKAHPVEVMPLRQAIVEVSALAGDFIRYAAEYKRRTAPKESTTELPPATTQPSGESST